ncbi:hypothetical protein [Microcella flavibacter]|uniref:hypothetical protein n=1 Tax=Microcella flavibacter TaxID=1804990 RepID=UPI0014564C7C|nr:hypothetical protein [Microcella flavibacter]
MIVELDCDGNLRVGHLAGSVDAVFGEDASDGRSGDLELSSYGSDVADSEVATNDELDFTRSELPRAPAGGAARLLWFP